MHRTKHLPQTPLRRGLSLPENCVSGDTDPNTELTVNVRLDTPVSVYSVPAASLYSITSTTACLISDGTSIQVSILASQFGNTLVQSDADLGQVSIDSGEDAASCR